MTDKEDVLVAMIAGALWRNGDLLLVPTFIFIGALAERLVNLVAFGTYANWLLPMVLDVTHIALLLGARHAFRQADEDAVPAPAPAPHRANMA